MFFAALALFSARSVVLLQLLPLLLLPLLLPAAVVVVIPVGKRLKGDSVPTWAAAVSLGGLGRLGCLSRAQGWRSLSLLPVRLCECVGWLGGWVVVVVGVRTRCCFASGGLLIQCGGDWKTIGEGKKCLVGKGANF